MTNSDQRRRDVNPQRRIDHGILGVL
jgi:hypothetical protein